MPPELFMPHSKGGRSRNGKGEAKGRRRRPSRGRRGQALTGQLWVVFAVLNSLKNLKEEGFS